MTDFNSSVIEEFRASGGRVGGALAGTPILLLHHVGARSGIARVTPLVYTPHGTNGYLIVASNGGAPTHPSWYYNLRAQPAVRVEIGSMAFAVHAEELAGVARAHIWPELLAGSSSLREFDAKAARPIPLFLLTRR